MSLFDVISIAIYIACGLLLGKFLGFKYGGGYAVLGFIAGFLLPFGFLRLVGRQFRKPKNKCNTAADSAGTADK